MPKRSKESSESFTRFANVLVFWHSKSASGDFNLVDVFSSPVPEVTEMGSMAGPF